MPVRGTVADLIVIGAGYWGTGVTIEARRAGWKVILLDDADIQSGSRNASAICDPTVYDSPVFRRYWPPHWNKYDLRESLDWLRKRGARPTKEWFWNRAGGRPPRRRGEALYLAQPDALLREAAPVRRTRVVGGTVTPGNIELVTDVGLLRGRKACLAAGYRTDELLAVLGLRPAGVGRLYGRGLVVRGSPAANVPLPVSVMLRPYQKHTVRAWGVAGSGLYKVGDTAERTPAPRHLEGLREVGRAVLDGYSELYVREGYRPVCDVFCVEELAPGVCLATGGNRVGLGLTGLVARKVMEILQ